MEAETDLACDEEKLSSLGATLFLFSHIGRRKIIFVMFLGVPALIPL